MPLHRHSIEPVDGNAHPSAEFDREPATLHLHGDLMGDDTLGRRCGDCFDETVELKEIVERLERNGGNKAKTAEELGISLKTLYNKLHQMDGQARRTA